MRNNINKMKLQDIHTIFIKIETHQIISEIDKLGLPVYYLDELEFIRHDLELIDINNKRTLENEFRNIIVDKYKRCVVTNCGELMCDICYFIDHEEIEQKYDPDNAILLNSCLCRLYERKMLQIARLNVLEGMPTIIQITLSPAIQENDNYKSVWKYHDAIIEV